MALLDNATNMFGPLSPDAKARIMAFIDAPSLKGWNDIYSCLISGEGMVTIWQAVIAVDPTFQRIGKPVKDPARAKASQVWDRYPDPLTVARAIRHATSPSKKTAHGG